MDIDLLRRIFLNLMTLPSGFHLQYLKIRINGNPYPLSDELSLSGTESQRDIDTSLFSSGKHINTLKT
jgi:hypothetical protein